MFIIIIICVFIIAVVVVDTAIDPIRGRVAYHRFTSPVTSPKSRNYGRGFKRSQRGSKDGEDDRYADEFSVQFYLVSSSFRKSAIVCYLRDSAVDFETSLKL